MQGGVRDGMGLEPSQTCSCGAGWWAAYPCMSTTPPREVSCMAHFFGPIWVSTIPSLLSRVLGSPTLLFPFRFEL